LFHGFPISASNTRTPVAEATGAQTQLTGVVAALTLVFITVAAPGTFRHLPKATLAAIVIAAAISLIDLPAIVRLYRVRRSEFLLAVAAWLAVATLGPVDGVVVAVVLSILNFLRLVWKPHTAELVRVDGLKGYHDRARHPEGHVVPGLLLYRFDSPLLFANSRYFAEDLGRRIAQQRLPVRRVVITAEPITDIDTSAAAALHDLVDELSSRDIELRFCELKGTVHDRLRRYEVFDDHEADHSARTTGEAVKQYIRDYPTEWVDWEDR
jgi:MFS superfamily sulfate permease-like transporter